MFSLGLGKDPCRIQPQLFHWVLEKIHVAAFSLGLGKDPSIGICKAP